MTYRMGAWTTTMLAIGAAAAVAAGCSNRKSSLLLERQARGALVQEQGVATGVGWLLEPAKQTKSQGEVEITAEYAPPSFLQDFFKNRKVFEEFAGLNPYFNEHFVLYVRIANASDKKIRINPMDFVLVDNRGNQYGWLHADYITAMAESKAPVGRMTRGVIEDARPGYFGIGVPVGRIFPKSQQRFALLQLSQLKEGYLHPGTVYDGLIAFWSPHQEATSLTLILGNIKTDFDANDWPKTSLDFVFEMKATHPNHRH